MADPQPVNESLSGCLLRLFWLFAGNALLALALIKILLSPPSGFALADAFYWSIFALILIARYVDVRYLHGATGEGKPATLADWCRHTIILTGIAGGAWCVVHLAVYFSR